MHPTRRQFLITTGALGAASMLAGPTALARPARKPKPMKILFLGGTGMLGPHAVRMFLDGGHEVTLFNRGNRDDLFPDLEFIQGNRIPEIEPGLKPLEDLIRDGRRWDAVIDTASVHTWVENSAKLLKDAADHYTFVSSVSVYPDNSRPGADETDLLAVMPDEAADAITNVNYNMMYYGAVKARAEAAAEKHFPGRTIVHRPGLLIGPRDYTHRFTYWPVRVRDGGRVLAPGEPHHPVQFTDVRDLAAFMVHAVEQRHAGIFNINGPVGGGMTMGKLLDACKAVTKSDAKFVWADAEWLSEKGVHAWAQMPLWIPPDGDSAGFHTRSIARAEKAGFTTRPLDQTLRDTLDWFDNEYLPRWKEAMEERGTPDAAFSFGNQHPGMTPARERELLEGWKERDAD